MDLYEAPATDASETTYELGADLEERGLLRMLSRLSTSKSVVLLGDVPRPFYEVPPCILRNESGLLRTPCPDLKQTIPMTTVRERQYPTYEALRNVAEKADRTRFFNPSEALCDDQGCPLFVGNELIYRDSNHLRRNLSDETIDQLVATMGLVEFLGGE